MIPVLLTQIKTRDDVRLDGIFVKPVRKGKTALIWLHGLTSYFHSSKTLIHELSSRCQKAGIGYLKFDTRGHDLITRGSGKHVLLGTLFEKFEDCIYDIRAMIVYAKRLGYKNIVLAGHSTGANKAVYYLYKTRDKSVKGVVLIGGINDIAAEKKRVGKKEFERIIRITNKLYRKDPASFFWSRGFLYTARRSMSLHTPESPEDVFPYYNLKARWKELKSIRAPLAVILGSRDEYLDRPAKELIEIFHKNATRTKHFDSVIIKGAGHSFTKKEKELAKTIVRWINRAIV
jgi:alpha-beta hydrolase superfamily lysophospholipase